VCIPGGNLVFENYRLFHCLSSESLVMHERFEEKVRGLPTQDVDWYDILGFELIECSHHYFCTIS
jgi:hypothetical protein